MKNEFKVYVPIIGENSSKLKIENIGWKSGVIVRSPNWLGDALMTLPALYQLRLIMPKEKSFDVVCSQKLASFWSCVSWVDGVIPFDAKKKRVSQKIKEEQIAEYDAGVAVILPNSFGSAFDMYVRSIPIRLGRAGHFRSLFLTHKLPKFDRKIGKDLHHQVTEYFDLIEPLGEISRTEITYPPLNVNTRLYNRVMRDLIDIFPKNYDKKLLVIAPGAAFGPAKQWPISYYKSVADAWTKTGGIVIVTGAPSEAHLGEIIAADNSNVCNLVGRTKEFPELITVLLRADVCLCNDSGTMHLAAACGKKGVAIFGSTSPIATGPLGGKWVIAQKDFACSPCLQRECSLEEDQRYQCLRQISVDEVIAAINSL